MILKEMELPEIRNSNPFGDDTHANLNFNESSVGFYFYPEDFDNYAITIQSPNIPFLFVCATNSSSREEIEGTCSIETASAFTDDSEQYHQYLYVQFSNEDVPNAKPFIWIGLRLKDLEEGAYLTLRTNHRYKAIKVVQYNEATFQLDTKATFEDCSQSMKLYLHDEVAK
ncbi:hypothetical protein L4D76_15605 [Photobacterium sagamiensis]|uniref:hypothetical protein n=1 Tax=Photobacterium sagamiensis TaxID=2910241 RepID=UPI003D15257E